MLSKPHKYRDLDPRASPIDQSAYEKCGLGKVLANAGTVECEEGRREAALSPDEAADGAAVNREWVSGLTSGQLSDSIHMNLFVHWQFG